MAQGAAGAFLAGTRPLGSWQEGGLGSAARRRPALRPSTQNPGGREGEGPGGAEPRPPRGHTYLLLGLDPHVLRPLLAVLAFVGAARLALDRLQPGGPWSHHLHGWHAATAALQEEEQGGDWRWDPTGIPGTGWGLWAGDSLRGLCETQRPLHLPAATPLARTQACSPRPGLRGPPARFPAVPQRELFGSSLE